MESTANISGGRAPIVILGGGPAGCATALGLAGHGLPVMLISRERRRKAIEGFSERTLKALEVMGAKQALAAVGPSVARQSDWAGMFSESSREWLVQRQIFDQALLGDVADAGVCHLSARIGKVTQLGKTWQLEYQTHDGIAKTLNADFLVEARGRQAPRGGLQVRTGPQAVALAKKWQLPSARSQSRVISFDRGWAWWASTDRQAVLQWILSGISEDNPEQIYNKLLEQTPLFKDWLQDAKPESDVEACGAGMAFCEHLISNNYLRVGDAAVSPDPLSGQGVFEALGSAMAAVPAIQTLLKNPGAGDYVERFYRQRCSDRFERIARSGRDFYVQEHRFADQAFWKERQQWPDLAPSHPVPRSDSNQIKTMPVVKDGFIVQREVVVSDDYPRGVWQLANVPVVDLRRYLQGGGLNPCEEFKVSGEQITMAQQWLQQRGLL